ncbi:MAG: GGDEF domain-containing protein [Elusimicrobia bacterium]|nr:GGDEF domain-containing protein [Elusimicrobiota bacterium]
MKKVFFYITLFLILLCFFVIYNQTDNYYCKYILILYLLPVSLLSKRPNIIYYVTLCVAAIVTALFTFKFSHTSLDISMIFLLIIPILLLFSTKKIMQYPNLKKRNNELKFYKEELINEEKSLVERREFLEKKLERIIQFYTISKDLTKNMDVPEDVANALFNVLTTRPGIDYVVITTTNYNDDKYSSENRKELKILSRLSEEKKQIWDKMIKDNNEISLLNGPAIIKSLYYIENKPVVAWPIIIDNKINSCTFLVTEPSYAQTYIEEGEFFIPHLKLGTKRIILFSELKEKARIDGLTGLYLKRFFLGKLHAEIERAKRYNTNFYLMMLDIDHFKNVNDNYGHLVGDEVLKSAANVIKTSIRQGDIPGRYGGEEFIVILPTIDQRKTIEIADTIRKSVKDIVFKSNGKTFSVTISIGIAKYIKDIDIDNLIGNADTALYQAKKSGRDNIILFRDDNSY